MNKYDGYLTGVNPNHLRKIVGEEKFYAYESATGTFVNGQGGEVKTMAEAIKKNEETEKLLKAAWPPQKAIGAANVKMTNAERRKNLYNKKYGLPKQYDVKKENGGVKYVGSREHLFEDLPVLSKNINKKMPNHRRIESDSSVRRRVWEKVEKNKAKGKKDYEDFADHEIMIAEDVAGIKKLQKEVSENLNAYLTDAVKDKRFVNSTPIPTPDFIQNPKPKSMGIANPELIAERQIISEVLNEKD